MRCLLLSAVAAPGTQARLHILLLQIGTPQYMAPEMHAGREYSYAADVWSLGCLLYELCALEPLFQDREEEVVARKVRFSHSACWKVAAVCSCCIRRRASPLAAF